MVLAVVVATAACGGDSSVSSRDGGSKATVTTDAPDDSGSNGADAYVGLTKKDAIAKAERDGHLYRIGREDDESFPATLDYNPDRVTFEIDDGKVTQASFG